MNPVLSGLHIAVFADEGVDVSTALLQAASHALQREGAITKVVSACKRPLDLAPTTSQTAPPVEIATADADAKDFDAALLVGGACGTDRDLVKLAAFVADLRADDKPVAAIGDGVGLCIASRVVAGARVAVDAAGAAALTAAGGVPVDEAVVVDGHLVTGRRADDVDAFLAAAIEAIRLKFRAATAGTPDLSAVGLATS